MIYFVYIKFYAMTTFVHKNGCLSPFELNDCYGGVENGVFKIKCYFMTIFLACKKGLLIDV